MNPAERDQIKRLEVGVRLERANELVGQYIEDYGTS